MTSTLIFLSYIIRILIFIGALILTIKPETGLNPKKIPKGKSYEQVVKNRRIEGIVVLILIIILGF